MSQLSKEEKWQQKHRLRMEKINKRRGRHRSSVEVRIAYMEVTKTSASGVKYTEYQKISQMLK